MIADLLLDFSRINEVGYFSVRKKAIKTIVSLKRFVNYAQPVYDKKRLGDMIRSIYDGTYNKVKEPPDELREFIRIKKGEIKEDQEIKSIEESNIGESKKRLELVTLEEFLKKIKEKRINNLILNYPITHRFLLRGKNITLEGLRNQMDKESIVIPKERLEELEVIKREGEYLNIGLTEKKFLKGDISCMQETLIRTLISNSRSKRILRQYYNENKKLLLDFFNNNKEMIIENGMILIKDVSNKIIINTKGKTKQNKEKVKPDKEGKNIVKYLLETKLGVEEFIYYASLESTNKKDGIINEFNNVVEEYMKKLNKGEI